MRAPRRRGRALLAALIAVGIAVYWPRTQRSAAPAVDVPTDTSSAAPSATASAAPAAVAARATALVAAPGETPRDRFERSSLRGTVPDGAIALDAQGRLRRDADLVRRFDYWLSLSGEWPENDIRAALFEETRAAHGEAVAAQVLEVFESYLALRAELAAMPATADLDARFERLRAARRAHFGADAEAMFGAEEDYLAQTLARRHLADDPAAVAEFDASRPAAQVAAERQATAAILSQAQSEQLDARQASPAERRAEREALWGADAAARLAALDAQRAAWDRRVAAYLQAREGITDVAALAALRSARFTPEERARIEALEAIGALRPPGG